MGVRNYLVEGVSGAGKTSVCKELNRRGYHALNGDRELAYQGDPETGEPIGSASNKHHIWDVGRVQALVADRDEHVTFFCGGSRNFSKFIELFDEVFVLDVDLDTLHRRLDQRPQDEWGSKRSERDLIVRLHRTKEDIPRTGIVIDATAPIADVVDEILRHTREIEGSDYGLAAARERSEGQVVEDALRAYLRTSDVEAARADLRSLMDRLAQRADLDDDAAMAVAVEEVQAVRAARRAASVS